MKRYNPLKAPVAEEWLALSEDNRLALIGAYHRTLRVPPPNLDAHAAFHSIVENQAALGDETPVQRTLARLVGEGMNRHDAVHAVASTLAEHISRLARGVVSGSDPNAAYFAALERLTEASWRRDFG